MQLHGIRTTGGRWSWVLRGADGTTLLQSPRTFGAYALSMIDAANVLDHLQTAPIEGADCVVIPPPRDAAGRVGMRASVDRGRDLPP